MIAATRWASSPPMWLMDSSAAISPRPSSANSRASERLQSGWAESCEQASHHLLSPLRARKVVELSPIFPLSRPPGWERVPDRAGEGSLSVKSNVLEMLFSVKERALTRPSATLSHCVATAQEE